MGKARFIVYATMFFLSIIAICAYFFIQNHKRDNISCNAFYAAKNSEARLVSENHMELNGEVGSWMMNGRIKVNEKDTYYFKLRAQFYVKRIGYVYYFTNNNVTIFPNDASENKTLQEFIAEILRIKDAQSFFTIRPTNDNYIIYSGEIPIMYCMSEKPSHQSTAPRSAPKNS